MYIIDINDMKIRKSSKQDVREIDKIYVQGGIQEGKLQFPKVPVKEMQKDFDKHKKTRTASFIKQMRSQKHHWIVAEEGGIIGIGHASIHNDEGEIEKVYVKKSEQGKGIGKQITKELISWLKKQGAKYIESRIFWNNTPSRKMHEKLGFKPISIKMRLK